MLSSLLGHAPSVTEPSQAVDVGWRMALIQLGLPHLTHFKSLLLPSTIAERNTKLVDTPTLGFPAQVCYRLIPISDRPTTRTTAPRRVWAARELCGPSHSNQSALLGHLRTCVMRRSIMVSFYKAASPTALQSVIVSLCDERAMIRDTLLTI